MQIYLFIFNVYLFDDRLLIGWLRLILNKSIKFQLFFNLYKIIIIEIFYLVSCYFLLLIYVYVYVCVCLFVFGYYLEEIINILKNYCLIGCKIDRKDQVDR